MPARQRAHKERIAWHARKIKGIVQDETCHNLPLFDLGREGQRAAAESMRRKSDQADRMFDKLVEFMNESQRLNTDYQFSKQVEAPSWLA